MGCAAATPQAAEKFVPTVKIKMPSSAETRVRPSLVDDIVNLKFSQSDMVRENKSKILREYNILTPLLGRGSFGEVRKALHKPTGMYRAVKIIDKRGAAKDQLDRIQKEVSILNQLDHPNIIKVYEYFQNSKQMFIITELCTGGELFDSIVKRHHLSEKDAAEVMRQVLSAVNYCHGMKIVHRDLKPENILLETTKKDSPIKVIDFGTSVEYTESKLTTWTGTPYYIAPEVLQRKYDEKCDVWSCGVILYILLSGTPPFNGKDDKEVLAKVAAGKYSMDGPAWKNISSAAKKLVSRMLDFNPEKRYSAEQALHDPWINARNLNTTSLNPAIFLNIRSFSYKNKIQEAFYLYIVTQLTSREEKAELMEAFQALDKNKDGKISPEELLEAYNNTNNPISEEEIEKIVSVLDADGSGYIDYSEFVAAASKREKILTNERIQTCFSIFDKDNSGSISVRELRMMFDGDKRITEKVWSQLLKDVDQNNDGEIQYSEFKDMLLINNE